MRFFVVFALFVCACSGSSEPQKTVDCTIPEASAPDAMPEASLPDAMPEAALPDAMPEAGSSDAGSDSPSDSASDGDASDAPVDSAHDAPSCPANYTWCGTEAAGLCCENTAVCENGICVQLPPDATPE